MRSLAVQTVAKRSGLAATPSPQSTVSPCPMTGRAASEGTRVGDVSDAAGGDGAGRLRLVELEPTARRRAAACDAADMDDRAPRAPGPAQDAGFGPAVGDAGAGGPSGVTSTAVAAGEPGAAITGAGAGFGSW